MCGIIGAALFSSDAVRDVYSGLERLEYRGYDSAGISVISRGELITIKRAGRVVNIREECLSHEGRVAIGHTRWATHGEPTDCNAHPHAGARFSVVHNGIIENFRELRAELESAGEKFASQTDSEVILKLLERNFSGDLLKDVAATVKRLKGSFALAILCRGFECVVGVRYKSPVVLGFSKDGVYLSSDLPALPESVTSICVPEDGDIAYITPSSASLYNFSLGRVNRIRTPAPKHKICVGLGGYPHYMLKETQENSMALRDTAEAFFRNANVKELSAYLRSADRIILTGCGTAYNAALAAAPYFKRLNGKFISVEIAGELRYDLPEVTPQTLVIAVTQSGETADVVEALRALKEGGARTVAVTNCGYSAITRVADLVVPVCAGAEICVAATKSYTGQLAALRLIAALPCDAFKVKSELISLCGGIDYICENWEKAQKIAAMCAASSAVFFLGRGKDYPSAVEASLKLKEVSYVFSDAYPAGELKHGTLALVDENTLSVFIICDGALSEKCENAVEQVVSRRGKAAVITTLPAVEKRLAGVAAVWLIPECPPEYAPFMCAPPLQLIAYQTAVILGRNPDKPRNLAKSVTVE